LVPLLPFPLHRLDHPERPRRPASRCRRPRPHRPRYPRGRSRPHRRRHPPPPHPPPPPPPPNQPPPGPPPTPPPPRPAPPAPDPFAHRTRRPRPLPPPAGVPRPSVGSDLADEHLTYLLHWVAQHRGWTIGPDTAPAACLAAAHATPVHPLRDYLESLAWDGSPRLTTWLQRYAGAPDSPTTSLIRISTLTAALPRLPSPTSQPHP